MACRLVHCSPYDTQVINCAKALVRAQRRALTGRTPKDYVVNLIADRKKAAEKALQEAVAKLEEDQKRVNKERREAEQREQRALDAERVAYWRSKERK